MKSIKFNQPRRALVGALAASVLLAGSLAACGSDDTATDDAGGNTTDTSTDDCTIDESAEPVRIGMEGPLTGPQDETGQAMLTGANFAAEKLNNECGILGRLVEIVPIDDQADPDVAETAATAAVAEGLDGVVGPYNSGAGVRSLPVYIEAGLVPIRLTSANTTEGLGFTLQPMTSQIAPTAATAITDWKGATSVAIIVDETQEYTMLAAEAVESLLADAGVTVTSVSNITPGASTYADTLATALADSPDLVYVVTYYPEAAAIAYDFEVSGTDSICMVDYGGFDSGFIFNAGTETAQLCSVVGVPSPSDFPGSDALISAFEDYFGIEPGVWTPYTYDSVLVLADAIERAGGTDEAALSEALAATTGWTGWTGSVKFEAGTGNRVNSVTVDSVVENANGEGVFTVDSSWAAAVGFEF